MSNEIAKPNGYLLLKTIKGNNRFRHRQPPPPKKTCTKQLLAIKATNVHYSLVQLQEALSLSQAHGDALKVSC